MDSEDRIPKQPPVPTQDEMYARIQANPAVQAFFAKYNPASTERFLDMYIETAHKALMLGPTSQHYAKERPLEYLNKAEDFFWEIQQKKLFNLQCRWRANLVKVPGMESVEDFEYWGHYIRSCPCVEPVTQAEVDMYAAFLLSGGRTHSFPHDWHYQRYSDHKEMRLNPELDRDVPEWYAWYDREMGTGDLIDLPDIRGQQEEKYLSKYWEVNPRPQPDPEKVAAAQEKSRQRSFWASPENMLDFAQRFDTPEVLEFLKWEFRDREEGYDYESVWEALHFLEDLDEVLTIVPHPDWREAVLLTVKQYKTRLTAAALQDVYNTYKMRMETGLGYPHNPFVKAPDGTMRERFAIHSMTKKRILEGRRLLGEPEDWNF